MDAQTALETALEDAETIVGGVTSDVLGEPTPCTGWDVRQLMNHLLGQLWAFEGRLAGRDPRHAAPPGGLPDTDLVGDDPPAAFAEVARAVLEASGTPGAHDRAGMAVGAYTTDVVVHGWDLAVATGRRATFDEDVARWCLDFVQQGITDDNRAPAFGPRAEPPPDPATIEQLVAFLGRTPPPEPS